MNLRSGTVMAAPGATGSYSMSDEGAALLQQGVGFVLGRWTALQLAIHNEWGGPSSHLKAQQLHNDIFHWLLQSKGPRYMDELVDLLDENLVQQFNTETEDGSLEEVAENLISMYEKCLEGSFEIIKELVTVNSSDASQSTSKSRQVEAENGEEDADLGMEAANRGADGMDVDESQEGRGLQAADKVGNIGDCLPAAEAVDGWQIVSSRSKRKPRKI